MRFLNAGLAVLLLYVVAAPAVDAQVARPPFRMWTPKESAEQLRKLAERKRKSIVRLNAQMDLAKERGSAIRLTIEVADRTIAVPANIRASLEEHRRTKAANDLWKRRWFDLERAALKKQQAELQSRGNSPALYSNHSGRYAGSRRGIYVSREQAIQELGPEPKVAARPARPMEPKMELVFQNVSQKPQRLYFGSPGSETQHLVRSFFEGEGLTDRINQTRYSSPSPLWLKESESIDLEPGETHRIPLNASDSSFPAYFIEPGAYAVRVKFISGVLPSKSFLDATHQLTTDAMVMNSEPVEFIVVFDR